jgi:hypothetical protein
VQTSQELSRAIDALPSRKALGKDSIPAELTKCCKNVLKKVLNKNNLKCSSVTSV